ncbi:MAG TPA: type II toxin-antitoxin system VapC family toxin [Pyrinomonadaceae bacterium]|nr:type II toxin-antitoxin system VapC family toxin [Pyrinomonadaceae bacterium]
MKPTVYIETSVISYLTSRPSRDILVASHQQITRDWWADTLPLVEPLVSAFVVNEAALGDATLAVKRLQSIKSFAELKVNREIEQLADEYFRVLNIPQRSRIDAAHMAVAVWHNVDYLLSWNCKHIASARVQKILHNINEKLGFDTPILCTPESLLEI